MKKNGFTLIELLATIVIILIIALLAVPTTLNIMAKSKERAYEELEATILASARIYVKEHKEIWDLIDQETGETIIHLQDLVDENLLESPIIDPRDNTEIPLDTGIAVKVIDYEDGEFSYFLTNDKVPPVITLLGSNPVHVDYGSTYNEPSPGATASDNIEGDISHRLVVTLSPGFRTTQIGSHYVIYNVVDISNNAAATVQRQVIVDDVYAPTITCIPNSNTTYLPAQSTTCTVTDGTGQSGVSTTAGHLQYVWTTSATQPADGAFTTNFTNGQVITGSGLNGSYYLWTKIRDNAGNIAYTRFGYYNFDNGAPTINCIVGSNATYQKTQSATCTVSDALSGVSTTAGDLKYVWTTSTTQPAAGSFTTNFTNGQVITGSGLDGSQYLWVMAKDNAANTTYTRFGTYAYDNTAPTTPSISGGNVSCKNTDSSITITAGTDALSGVNRTEYSTNGTTWTTYSAAVPFTTTTNITFYARTIDNAGNISANATTTIIIDKTAPPIPTITGGNATWKNTDSSISVSVSTDTGCGINRIEYSTNGSTWITYSAAVPFNTNTNIIFYARSIDNAGNPSPNATTTVKIDKTVPTSPTLSGGNAAWKNTNSSITVTAGTDALSGVDITEYSTNGTTWTTYSAAVAFTTTTDITFYARTIDNAGNVSTNATTTVMIDKTAPTVPTIAGGNAAWKNTDSSITVSGGTDANSGIASRQYSTDGTTWTTYSAAIGYTVNTDITFYARTVDNVGNVSTNTTTTVKIDKTAPTAPTITGGNGSWKASDSSITVSGGTDALSGIASRQYSTNGSTWTTYSAAVAFTSTTNITFYARTVDAAGNVSPNATTTVIIDQTAPAACSFNLNGYTSGVWTNGNVTTTLSSSDAHSGLAGYQYSHDASTWNAWPANPWTISWSGNWAFYCRSVDNVGNIGPTSSSWTLRIDKDAPTCTSGGGSTTWTNGNRVITGTCSDSGSGCASNATSRTYSTETNTTTAAPSSGVTDNAGNTGTCPANQTVRIDKTAPTATAYGSGTAGAWRSDGPTVNFGASDTGGSGLNYWQIAWYNSGTWNSYITKTGSTYSEAFTSSGYRRARTYAVDNAGNSATTTTSEYWVDLTAPSCNITNDTGYNVTNTGSDSHSGFDRMSLYYDHPCDSSITVGTYYSTPRTYYTQRCAGEIVFRNRVYDNVGRYTTCSKTASSLGGCLC